jgi:hypothetical protein
MALHKQGGGGRGRDQMTFTIMISLGVLTASVLSSVMLAPSRRSAGCLFAQSQWPVQGGEPLRSGKFC